jgi:hypothetical protein
MGYFGPGPDVVVLLLDHDKPVRGLIVDVQSEVDPEKRLNWPVYVAGSFLLQECPTELLVVALEPAIADWCAEPIEIGPPGFVLYPRVLSRTGVPVVTDPQEAARRPELGVLSAIAHGETKQGPKIAAAVLPALQGLEADRARLYYDLVINSLNEDARHDLQARTSG